MTTTSPTSPGTKKFTCRKCQLTFPSKNQLYRHLGLYPSHQIDAPCVTGLAETGKTDKTYGCRVCHQTFTSRSRLWEHITSELHHMDEYQKTNIPGIFGFSTVNGWNTSDILTETGMVTKTTIMYANHDVYQGDVVMAELATADASMSAVRENVLGTHSHFAKEYYDVQMGEATSMTRYRELKKTFAGLVLVSEEIEKKKSELTKLKEQAESFRDQQKKIEQSLDDYRAEETKAIDQLTRERVELKRIEDRMLVLSGEIAEMTKLMEGAEASVITKEGITVTAKLDVEALRQPHREKCAELFKTQEMQLAKRLEIETWESQINSCRTAMTQAAIEAKEAMTKAMEASAEYTKAVEDGSAETILQKEKCEKEMTETLANLREYTRLRLAGDAVLRMYMRKALCPVYIPIPEGLGVYTRASDGTVYRGAFKNGKPDGYGQAIFGRERFGGIPVPSPTIRTTPIATGVGAGVGVGVGIRLPEEPTSYLGWWKNGMFDGEGEYRTPEYIYQGPFKRNQKHQRGVMVFTGDFPHRYYMGEFVRDLKHGHGHEYSREYEYEGTYDSGVMHGQGTLTETGVGVYRGTFVNNAKEGQGVKEYTNGDHYQGEWKANEQTGRGVYISKSGGYTLDGIFECGVLMYGGEIMTSLGDGQSSVPRVIAYVDGKPVGDKNAGIATMTPSSEPLGTTPVFPVYPDTVSDRTEIMSTSDGDDASYVVCDPTTTK